MPTQTTGAVEARTPDPATSAANSAASPKAANGPAEASPLLVVDLGKRQSKRKIKDLRKGRGKLVPRVEKIVQELVQSGAVAAGAQPVVIVVREEVASLWPLS